MKLNTEQIIQAGIQASNEAKELNLNLTQYLLLGVISTKKDIELSNLEKITGMNRTTISKSLKVLESRNIIFISKNNLDSRKRIVNIVGDYEN